MTRILVPLDGSTLAERALPCATMLARCLHAELVLLQAVSLPADLTARLGRSDSRAEAALEELMAQASDYLSGIAAQVMADQGEEKALSSIQQVVRPGPAADTIVDHAAEIGAALIAMTTHGYSGITRWRHGSVAERVLQSADHVAASVRRVVVDEDDLRAELWK